MDARVSGTGTTKALLMSFSGLQLRFIRFLGPGKESAEFTFTSGLNILWGSSDTGKTFLVEAIDFMLGAGEPLKDIPERVGYDRILLGLTTASGKDYTLHRSTKGGGFLRFDGLLAMCPTTKGLGRHYQRATRRGTMTTYPIGSCRRSASITKRFCTARHLGS
jgi:hypothetical protein